MKKRKKSIKAIEVNKTIKVVSRVNLQMWNIVFSEWWTYEISLKDAEILKTTRAFKNGKIDLI